MGSVPACTACLFYPQEPRDDLARPLGANSGLPHCKKWVPVRFSPCHFLPRWPSNKFEPTLNQRYAATEREQTRLDVTLFVNVLGFSGELSPLITVWFLVRVQAGPPTFAREASEGCRAGAEGEGGLLDPGATARQATRRRQGEACPAELEQSENRDGPERSR